MDGGVTIRSEAGVTERHPFGKEPVPTVVFVGRLSANKRPDHAVRAFGIVRHQIPEAQMWVIGAGPEESRLRRLAGPGVAFLGVKSRGVVFRLTRDPLAGVRR